MNLPAAGPNLAGRIALFAGLTALLLYSATASRGVVWQDSGVHQYRIAAGQAENPYGLALSHPLHHWIGRGVAAVVPPEQLGFALNLISAIAGATGIGLIAGLTTALTGVRLAGLIAGLTAGVAHAYWQLSAVTETYTLQVALLAAEWCLLLRYLRTGNGWWLSGLFFINGLHVANHLLGLLALATYGVLVIERLARRRLPVAALPALMLGWVLGALPYLVLIAGHYARNGDLAATLYSALFGAGTTGGGYRRHVLNVSISSGQLRKFAMILGYNFPSLAGLIALGGIAASRWRIPAPLWWVLVAQSLLYFAFVARYPIEDQYTFLLPVCALCGVWCGLGVAAVLEMSSSSRVRRYATGILIAQAVWPVGLYIAFPWIAQQRGWLGKSWRDLPYRDEYSSFLHPWKHHDDSAERYTRDTLAQIAPGGWILADATTACPIAFTAEVTGLMRQKRPLIFSAESCVNARRPRLNVEELRAFLAGGGDVLAVPSYDVEKLWGADFEIERNGDWWRLRLRAAASRPAFGAGSPGTATPSTSTAPKP